MCTVSYIPQEGGFVLTSNRDENPNRKTSAPELFTLENSVLLKAPLDMEKGGTWIAMEQGIGRVACLLNGARIKHKRTPPYRKSRGEIVLDAFLSRTFEQFVKEVSLEEIEPFTLILADANYLIELVWNGNRKEINSLDKNANYLWSSSTLYSLEQKKTKQAVFEAFVNNKIPSPKEILSLHGIHGRKDFLLNREKVKTVSITQVITTAVNAVMEYHDQSVLEKTNA
ncbi:NRDE family protein [Ascidiimonas sp. W6]|uniref:NRDE family protein n=1 Tax=Ascidiimonas meishanensis TaxID=3128903 RepID=UPI0030EF185B